MLRRSGGGSKEGGRRREGGAHKFLMCACENVVSELLEKKRTIARKERIVGGRMRDNDWIYAQSRSAGGQGCWTARVFGGL